MQTVHHFYDLDLTKQYSYADYLVWEFKDRVELIRGFIHKMSPAPNRKHQKISQNVNGDILTFFKTHPFEVYVAPFDVRLPTKKGKKDHTVVQPDLCIVCDLSKLDDQGCNGAPDLIIEILSPKNNKHDLYTKFNLYEESGVKEYWIVQPEQQIVLVYTLQNEKYIGLRPFTEDDVVKSIIFPDMKLLVNDIFKDF